MLQYNNQAELVEKIKFSYSRFINEFNDISEDQRNVLLVSVDRTPSQMLSYQLGWLTLLLSWEQQEKTGKTVITPTPDFKWNNLGGLYQQFYSDFGNQSLIAQREQLNHLVQQVCDWILTLSTDELFGLYQRNWANNKAQWPLWKWIHINTVAPFTNFRPKIRKWKKLYNNAQY